MRLATRPFLAALAFALAAGAASAQNDVTFEVDLQFCPTDVATDTVLVRGSFNDWSNDPDGEAGPRYDILTDPDDNGTYTGTVSLPEGVINYKFYAGTPRRQGDTELGYEDGSDRSYTVTNGAQAVGPVAFRKASCVDPNQTEDYEIDFVVDMSVQIAQGNFNPGDGDRVALAGSFTGWDAATAVQMEPESDNPTIYSTTINKEFAAPSQDNFFKFVILSPNGSGGFNIAYEQPDADVTATKGGQDGGDRVLALTGQEEQDPTTGNRFFTYDNDDDESTSVYYSDDTTVPATLSGPAKVTFVVDLRPAYYALRDRESIPNSAGANPVSTFEAVYVNGPIFGESDQAGAAGAVDWASWTAADLGDVRKLGNFDSQDSTYSITLDYSAGAKRVLQGKLSLNGPDNEGGPFDDKFVTITEGTQTINLIFGAQVKEDGTYSDETENFKVYDPYIVFDNTASPPTVSVVRRGGEDRAVSNERGPGIDGLAIGAAYPNPAVGRMSLDLTLDRSMDVAVRVYDVTGRLVTTLAEGLRAVGPSTVSLETAGLSAGLYLVRVDAGGQTATRRFSVVR